MKALAANGVGVFDGQFLSMDLFGRGLMAKLGSNFQAR